MKIKGLGSLAFGVLLIFFCAIVVGVGFVRLRDLTDLPGVMLTFGITGGCLLMAFGLQGLLGAFTVAVRGVATSGKAAQKAVGVCRAAVYMSIISGLIGTLIGLINALSQGMYDPSVMSCGAAMSLFTVLYGVAAAGLAYVLEWRCRVALAEFPAENE